MSLTPADVSNLIEAYSLFQNTAYFYPSAITVLVYDIIYKLDDEIMLIWRSAWSFPKVLYIVSRYYHLAYLGFEFVYNSSTDNISPALCKQDTLYEAFGGRQIIVLVMSLILALRVSALYGHSRTIVISLSVLCSGIFAASIVGNVIGLKGTYIVASSDNINSLLNEFGFPELPTCLENVTAPQVFSVVNNHVQIAAWVLLIGSELIMFSLTVIQLWGSLPKRDRSSNLLARIWTLPQFHSPLMTSIYLDGSVYFVIVFMNIILTALPHANLQNFLTFEYISLAVNPYTFVFYSLAGSRFILHLRKVSLGGDLSATSVSAPIQFNMFAARPGASTSVPEDNSHSESAGEIHNETKQITSIA